MHDPQLGSPGCRLGSGPLERLKASLAAVDEHDDRSVVRAAGGEVGRATGWDMSFAPSHPRKSFMRCLQDGAYVLSRSTVSPQTSGHTSDSHGTNPWSPLCTEIALQVVAPFLARWNQQLCEGRTGWSSNHDRYCRQRDLMLTVKRVLIVVWPPLHRQRRGTGGHGTPAHRTAGTDSVRSGEPVELALARSVDQFPGPHALPGGSGYEAKWDGSLHSAREVSAVDRSARIGSVVAFGCGDHPQRAGD